MKPPVLILHAKGTNRDLDVAEAIAVCGGAPEIVSLDAVLHDPSRLADHRMLVLPGGFSFGDDLGAGRVLGMFLRHPLKEALTAFVESGKPVLGICNGFQALVQAGLLHAETTTWATSRSTTLTQNASGRFECRWVELHPQPQSTSVFTSGWTTPVYCPVAHGEGRIVVRDAAALEELERGGHIALRYGSSDYPGNPNGSVADIAGLCNARGNVLGLMPHPENHIHAAQHPHPPSRTRSTARCLFESGIRHAAAL